jgi:hypothetical protein
MQAEGDDSVLAAPAGSEEVEERYLLLGLDLLRAQPLSAGS